MRIAVIICGRADVFIRVGWMRLHNAMRKTLVTIDGHIGSGAFDVGRKIARMFGWRYFDRVRLQSLNRNGRSFNSFQDDSASVSAADAEFSERLWTWVERAASYFAVGAAGDDPMLQGAADLHLPLTWDRNGPSAEKTIDDAYDLSNVAKNGNAVIVHRAGAVELANQEDVARVGIFADWDDRVVRVMHREGLSNVAQAERIIADREEAQKEYFYQLHRADPEDPDIYDFVINTSDKNIDIATIEVSRYVKEERDRVAV